MVNLYDIMAHAQAGAAIHALARHFGLTPEQTETAVEALLPAFSLAFKQMASTPEGMAALMKMMAQPNYHTMFDNPSTAFAPLGMQAGQEALLKLFGSPDISRMVANQASQFSGLGVGVVQQMMPAMASMLMGGLFHSLTSQAGGATEMFRQMVDQMTGAAARLTMPGAGMQPADALAKTFEHMGEENQKLLTYMFETGRNVQESYLDNMQRMFNAFFPDRPGRSS